MSSYCCNLVYVGGAYIPALIPVAGGGYQMATASGCTSGYMVTDNADYLKLTTAYTASQNQPTMVWPELFNLSVADGATLSVAILAVWVSAFAYRTLRRVLNQDGEKE